jgi:2-oxoglutarate ferredoxin oxidoreductase subunit beta
MIDKSIYGDCETAWCPGCGNFPILDSLKQALADLGKQPHQVLVCSGIGQAAKTPQYIKVNGFNGLHGRALPPALGAKIANRELTVIVASGDGDTYGEGGNHFIHNIRRNIDIAHFVHNNQIYGLTKGQASPTTDMGHITEMQNQGVHSKPVNPILMALFMGAPFVARSFAGDKRHLTEMMKAAIEYKGYALVDILQPCVTFNKINTYSWYRERAYTLDGEYDPSDFKSAIDKAMEWGDRIPIGIIYKNPENPPNFIDSIPHLRDGMPLVDQALDPMNAEKYMEDFR